VAYIDLAYLRANGISESDLSDADATIKIASAQQYIDNITGIFFESQALVFQIDGTGHETLYLPFPIITLTSITQIFINSSEVLEASSYKAYDRVSVSKFIDDRGNPKVKRVNSLGTITPTVPDTTDLKFTRGSLNFELAGNFGWLNEDDETPEDIQRIMVKLIYWDIKDIADPTRPIPLQLTRLEAEVSDLHSYQLSSLAGLGKTAPFTGDPEIDTVLLRYQFKPEIRIEAV